MPSPVGHSLAGVAVFAASRALHGPLPESGRGARLRRLLILAVLVLAANAPDLDFLPGLIVGDPDRYHHGPAHSLGAALAFGLVITAVTRSIAPRLALRSGVLMTLAFVSHLLLDMLSVDVQPPRGVPLLWPLTQTNYAFPIELFLDIRRNTATGNFFTGLLVKSNVYSALWEAFVMSSVLALGHAAGGVAQVLRSRIGNRRALGETPGSGAVSAGARD